MNSDEIRQRVWEALNNALKNGYEQFVLEPASIVAEDIAEYDAGLEHVSPLVMEPVIEAWQKNRITVSYRDLMDTQADLQVALCIYRLDSRVCPVARPQPCLSSSSVCRHRRGSCAVSQVLPLQARRLHRDTIVQIGKVLDHAVVEGVPDQVWNIDEAVAKDPGAVPAGHRFMTDDSTLYKLPSGQYVEVGWGLYRVDAEEAESRLAEMRDDYTCVDCGVTFTDTGQEKHLPTCPLHSV